jgi:NADH-quinone oxidoreductase subunit L
VIHAMGGEQDMRKMGGLRTKIPVTFWTMFAGTVAIAGIPGFSGFFSKDEILFETFAGPYRNVGLWVVGLIAALMTSFYMFRLLFITFFGTPRYDEHKVHVHESPKSMTVPLILLAILAVGGGWWALPGMWGRRNYFANFLAPVFASAAALAPAVEGEQHSLELGLTLIATIVALTGLLIAWGFYIRSPNSADKAAASFKGLHRLLLHKYFVDEVYAFLIIRPLFWISTNVLWHVVDETLIDGTVNGSATVAQRVGGRLRRIQSGNTRSYASWMVMGAIGVTALLLGFWEWTR